MSEMPERRDIQGLMSDIRVDIATIKERQLADGKTLGEMKAQIGGVVFREEYERRHNELIEIAARAEEKAETARDDNLRRQGADRVWRLVFTGALAVLGLLEGILHLPKGA